MNTEKYCSPVATQLFLDLSSIESKDGQRDTYNDLDNYNFFVCEDYSLRCINNLISNS